MRQIIVRMLDSPSVELDETPIHFPYKKVEGLFYYICINKKITRDDAVRIFWADSPETVARKNLRDALYQIKKLFKAEVLLTIGNNTIALSSDFLFSIDADIFIQYREIDLYKADFLSNFFIKNCYEFESWVEEKKNNFKFEFLELVNLKLSESIVSKDIKRIQYYGNILLENDSYNEASYRKLMKIYASNGNFNLSTKLYHDLHMILEKELSTIPEDSTKKLFESIVALKKTSETDNNDFFYGRYDEIYEINSKLHNFAQKSSASIIVSGEAGIGKTYLLEKICSNIDTENFLMLHSTCHEAESAFFLKPWSLIFEILGEYIVDNSIPLTFPQKEIISYMFPNFNKNSNTNKFDNIENLDETRYQIATGAIEELFINVSKFKKIIFAFDDIQWMDNMSLTLLKNLIIKLGSERILLLATYREDYEDDISSFTVPLFSKEMLSELKINRFNMDETKEIISRLIPEKSDDNNFIEKIYKDTEGNALFLIELLKVVKEHGYTKELSSKATNVIKSRLLNLDSQEKKSLGNMSIFFDKFTIDELKIISSQDEMAMFDDIEALQSKHLIRESVSNNNIYYNFSHQKIREYVYNKQSAGKLKILHKKMATYYENRYLQHLDFNLCSNIIYHFDKCGDAFKVCKYKVEYMKEFYTIYHETYPVIYFEALLSPVSNEDFEKNEKSMIELSKEIQQLGESSLDILYLQMEMYYIMGRYYISSGSYDSGLENINNCIRISLDLNNRQYMLNCYKQLIFHSIQIDNMEVMKKYIGISFDLLEGDVNTEDFATFLRLKGLYLFKAQEYTQAIQVLIHSLDIFVKLNNQKEAYSLNIAACYNYIGQICRTLGNKDKALSYFNKAIIICNKKYNTNGLGIFYSNAGQVLYEMERFEESKENIYKSIEYFKRNNSLWGRGISEAYAAILNIENNNLDDALSHYEIAKDISSKISDPVTFAIVENIAKILF